MCCVCSPSFCSLFDSQSGSIPSPLNPNLLDVEEYPKPFKPHTVLFRLSARGAQRAPAVPRRSGHVLRGSLCGQPQLAWLLASAFSSF